MLKTVQIGINTADMPGTLRLYSEALGFRNGGGSAVWGKTIGVQGLGPDSRALMWWMIGADDFFQLELFSHSVPAQRPLPEDWKPSDHGWTRFGIKVSDFDHSIAELAAQGVIPITSISTDQGIRRAAIRDPYAGIIIEIIEGGRGGEKGPEIAYIASSVADLDAARSYYGTLLGFPILPLESLHGAEDEAIWGLPGAQRDGFVVDSGGILLEILHYADGRPKPADYRISDQGIMNIAMGARDRGPVAAALDRLAEAGFVPPFRYDEGPTVCGYINDASHEVEFTSVPEEADSIFGFAEAPGFLR